MSATPTNPQAARSGRSATDLQADYRTLSQPVIGNDWRILSSLSVYRWLLSGSLCGLVYTGMADQLFELDRPLLLVWTAGLYLFCAGLFSLLLLLQRPGALVQLFCGVSTDIAAICMIIHAAGGIASGMGVLLFLPIAGAGILLRPRDSVLLAAIATVALLVLEFLTQIRADPEPAALTAAGILGALLLISAFVASTLSRRARVGEALAEQRRLEVAELARLNERIIRKIQIGVLVVENDDRIRIMNQAAVEMLDINESAVGQHLSDIAPEIATAISAWRSQRHGSSGSARIDTHERRLLLHFSIGGTADHHSMLIFIENAARIAEQAQQMKLASLGRLSASVAHEIRNPLSAISHASQLLGEFIGIKPDDRKLLEIIERHARRINRIIEDMLSLSRRGGDAHAEDIDLKPWLHEFIEDISVNHDGPPVNLDWTAALPDLTLRVDTGHLHQILQNLISNAVQHAKPEHGELKLSIKVGIWPHSQRIFIDVQDNGRGISAEEIENIFDPFYTTSSRGTGLGLYIVRELCECNLAQLSYVPTGGIGTCFRITFPRPDEWLTADEASLAKPSTQKQANAS